MESSRCFRGSFHGSEHRVGYRLGLDAALRALVPIPDWSGHGGELVRAWLGWLSRCLVSSMLFGACWSWNVTCLRKGLSDGLPYVSPDELSGLTGKSVGEAFMCVLEACAVESMGEECQECVDDVIKNLHHGKYAMMEGHLKTNPSIAYALGCGGTNSPRLQSLLWVKGTATNPR